MGPLSEVFFHKNFTCGLGYLRATLAAKNINQSQWVNVKSATGPPLWVRYQVCLLNYVKSENFNDSNLKTSNLGKFGPDSKFGPNDFFIFRLCHFFSTYLRLTWCNNQRNPMIIFRRKLVQTDPQQLINRTNLLKVSGSKNLWNPITKVSGSIIRSVLKQNYHLWTWLF